MDPCPNAEWSGQEFRSHGFGKVRNLLNALISYLQEDEGYERNCVDFDQ